MRLKFPRDRMLSNPESSSDQSTALATSCIVFRYSVCRALLTKLSTWSLRKSLELNNIMRDDTGDRSMTLLICSDSSSLLSPSESVDSADFTELIVENSEAA